MAAMATGVDFRAFLADRRLVATAAEIVTDLKGR